MKTSNCVPGAVEPAADSEPALPAFKPFDRVAIVGVGLMGGSLGMALRKRGMTHSVLGIDVRADVLDRAVTAGAIDTGADSLCAAAEAECVVFAAPVAVLSGLMEAGAGHVRPDALITDLGSVKKHIVETGERLFGARFVGGHPMAGSEESGIAAARADLFEGAAWAVVRSAPIVLDEDAPARRIAAMIAALGGRPVTLTASSHDHLAALVSHLPHLVSFAFARTVHGDTFCDVVADFAGGSYRDLSRVSRSDPELWNQIFRENRAELLAVLTSFETSLQSLRNALEEERPVL